MTSLQFTWTTLAAFFAVYFLAFFEKMIAGFGDPLISAPLLSMFIELKGISPLNLLASLPANAYITWRNRRDFSWKTVRFALAFILLGVIPGTLLLKLAVSKTLKIFLGIVIIGIGIEMATRNRSKTITPNRAVMAFVCFCSGVCAALYGINLFFVAYMERTAQNRGAFRSNICFIFLIECLFRFVVYSTQGIMNEDVFKMFLAAIPGIITGAVCGILADKYLKDKAVTKIITFVFILGGVSTILNALFR